MLNYQSSEKAKNWLKEIRTHKNLVFLGWFRAQTITRRCKKKCDNFGSDVRTVATIFLYCSDTWSLQDKKIKKYVHVGDETLKNSFRIIIRYTNMCLSSLYVCVSIDLELTTLVLFLQILLSSRTTTRGQHEFTFWKILYFFSFSNGPESFSIDQRLQFDQWSHKFSAPYSHLRPRSKTAAK